jgi:hypothetical protein
MQGNPATPPGIESVNKRKVYYTRMRKFTLTVPSLFVTLLTATLCIAQQQPSQQTVPLKTASLESHEGITISAEPWTDAALYKDKFGKKSPFAAGVLAVNVVFRNDSDQTVRVNLERIRLTFHLDEDNAQEVQPLTADQLADAVLKPGAKDPTKTRKKLPFPVPTSGTKKSTDKNWIELQQEAQNAGVPSSVVAAHSSVKGLLYFDLQGQFDLLSSSHLYVPEITVMDKGRSLTYFDIDLSRPSGN